MGQDAFVDVAYRGLELGRRLKLREVGPRTAYLEHGTPMPVGAGLVIRTDDGLDIPVVVVRVHEQVAGADMPPGMRVRAQALDGAAASWWSTLVSRDDPEIPEPERVVVPPPPPLPAALPEEPPQAHDTVVMDAVDATEVAAELAAAAGSGHGEADGGNGAGDAASRHTASASHTVVMSAVEISAITDLAGEDSDEAGGEGDEGEPSAGGNGAPGSNGDELQGARGRGKRRRRRR